MKDAKVVVLLAAFNGAKYIEQQVDSILSSFENVSVVVGLDPSSDDTEQVLKRFKDEPLLILRNEKASGGAKQNFSKLSEYAVFMDGGYFAFSDQDDVWDDGRIAITLQRLKELEARYGAETPLLVFSDSRIVSEDLTVTEPSFLAAESLAPSVADNYKRLALQNVGQGCTFLFNRALLELATPVPEAARMHDHWFMLVACVFGKVDCVARPLLSYRQHSSNVLGSKGYDVSGAAHRAFRRSDSIRLSLAQSEAQAKVFALRYRDQLSPKAFVFFSEFGAISEKGFLGRRWFCLRNGLRMSGLLRTVGLYVFV